jgi:RND superfamily putative drug exporter
MARLTSFVLRHRRLVAVFWLAVFVAAMAGSSRVSDRLGIDFSLPGQPGSTTAAEITQLYGNGGSLAPSVEVVTVPQGQTVAQDQAKIAAAFDAVRQGSPALRVVDYASTHDARFVTSDGRSTFALLFAPMPKNFQVSPLVDQATTTISKSLGSSAQVTTTGVQELASGNKQDGPGVFAETLIGAAGALVVLAFVFGSLLAVVPLLIAAVAITTTLLIVLGLTYLTDVSFVVEFLVALVGLGVAIDYSLLVVTRWREERASGKSNEAAIHTAVNTAGRAVLFSGITVGIGLLGLVILPVPGLRSVGFGGMLIPIVSVAVSLTLLPAVLGGVGRRLDWPRLRHEDHVSRPWAAWGRTVVRHRGIAAGAALVALGVMLLPIFGIRIGSTSPDALASTGAAHDAYHQLIDNGVPGGVVTPMEVLVDSSSATAARDRLASVPGIGTVAQSSAADSNHAGTTVLVALPQAATTDSSSTTPVTAAHDALAGMPGVHGVAGVGAIQLDYVNAVIGDFPLMLGVIALLTFLLLARAFRSIVLPLKAVILNLVSLSATFGLITWFWQDGHGSGALFGIQATGAITFWVPLMIIAFLFGLSMDYEVFILSRMREEYDRTGSTNTAVIEGLGRTGRLVTSAALILFLAFASLAAAPSTDLKVFATALGVGILLDATVVRALLLPALVSLFGKWNWWMPDWAARALFLPRESRKPAVIGMPVPVEGEAA